MLMFYLIVLRLVHIVASVCWAGGAFIFFLFVEPTAKALAPGGQQFVQTGDVVRVILTNTDGMAHDLFIPDLGVRTSPVSRIGERAEIVFEVRDAPPGVYACYCTSPGHRQAGQEGRLIVEGNAP